MTLAAPAYAKSARTVRIVFIMGLAALGGCPFGVEGSACAYPRQLRTTEIRQLGLSAGQRRTCSNKGDDTRTSKCHRLDDATDHRWPSKLDTLGAALWAEDSGGRELEDPGSLAKVRGALQDAGAPEGELFYRRENEHYGRAAERAAADIIVEDDCESIGGPAQMTYPKLGPDSKARTKSVVIPEWGGIDHLPTDPEKLRTY